MEILAHRGAWSTREEHNSLEALQRAWRAGHGVETDVRDHDGQIVIDHDPPIGAHHLSLEEVLHAWSAEGRGTSIALNVKADGLAPAVTRALVRHGVMDDAFVFDMAVPDHLAWWAAGVRTYSRTSDVESPVLVDRTVGTWWDAFEDDLWWDPQDLEADLARGRRAALVSPELHARDPLPVWERVRDHQLHRVPGLALCTDRVDEATEFFQ